MRDHPTLNSIPYSVPSPCCLVVLAFAVCSFGLPATGEAQQAKEQTAAGVESFERKVRPLLARRCYECHSADAETLRGGLRLDDPARLLAGGDSGPAVVPGKPAESLLIQAVQHEVDGLEMPPDGKLAEREIAELIAWVRRGAPVPQSTSTGPAQDDQEEIDWEVARQFWSFRPLETKKLPKPMARWPRRRIDCFISARLQAAGLLPSPAADRRTLIRRATFDLLGPPPSPEEIRAFVNDPAPDAYERLIDRLLASPHYGERWGRFWLDLVRYTDVTASWLKSTGKAYLYRDWVVRAWNEDVPYDDFVRRQLATDLLPETGSEDIPALGLLGLSPTYWKELKLAPDVIKKIVADEWEERIDVVSRTFLGLTAACARCHDHKFDPITMEDYYAMAGVIASTRLADRPIIPAAEAQATAEARAEASALEAEVEKLAKQKGTEMRIAALRKKIETLRGTPHFATPLAHAVDDAAIRVLPNGPDHTKIEYQPGKSRDLPVFIRGNPSRPGEVVARRFLQLFSKQDDVSFHSGSGRRELAEAIVTDAAPLAARVIVNRIWLEHFGRGLVETPSNFGRQGARPSHPDLLDDLAAQFIEHGWSLKWLHREIMLSAAYRQASTPDAKKSQLDPGNRRLWRMNRRRLTIESWRDAMLAASGELETRLGGPPLKLSDVQNRRRTIYALVHRRDVDKMLKLYDFPDPTAHSPHRQQTTTALQQLFVLNSPFIQARAKALAARSIRDVPEDEAARIDRSYLLLFGRPARTEEIELGRGFLESQTASGSSPLEAWTRYAHVLVGCNELMYID